MAGVAQRKSGIVVPHPLRWHGRLAAAVIYGVVRLFSATWRVRANVEFPAITVSPNRAARSPSSTAESLEHPTSNIQHPTSNIEPPMLEAAASGSLLRTPVIFCTWHNRLALSMVIQEKFARHGWPSAGLGAMISASKDGGLLAAVLKKFGVQAIRGSSSRRGPQALLECTTWLEKGCNIAITPDGPRGPCYRIQEGILVLAQVSGAPIVPVSSHVRRKVSLRSWDRFQIPLPFARCEVFFGEPISVPRGATDGEREEIRRQLQEAMMKITRD